MWQYHKNSLSRKMKYKSHQTRSTRYFTLCFIIQFLCQLINKLNYFRVYFHGHVPRPAQQANARNIRSNCETLGKRKAGFFNFNDNHLSIIQIAQYSTSYRISTPDDLFIPFLYCSQEQSIARFPYDLQKSILIK